MNDQTLYTINQFCELERQHTPASVRWLVARSDQNGFEQCIVRLGRRVLIDRQAYREWANSKRGGHNETH